MINDNSNGAGLVLFTRNPGLLPQASLGDFNDDGVSDGEDFLVWQRGQSPHPMSLVDLAEWKANFATLPATSVASPLDGGVMVPEPSLLAAAVSAGAVCLRKRRRRR
jgi:hypothetical protein